MNPHFDFLQHKTRRQFLQRAGHQPRAIALESLLGGNAEER
jgi:hypothetical protein